ncbi:hypothetical protein DGMP_20480 [Desulfomarina profundi]|uniref:Thioesterase n=1 Tax=Desulfomarina profundi TaxID=2772557 RepID=A0A8D5JPK0_9BACT|nr:hypothetical protein [Desulfomarina profundi]BCL61355.1 hypothetical protein DGMP_20480 [Desulfomarina profundi]
MKEIAFQDLYPEDYTNCYGCGRNNPAGLHLKSYWDGEESVCRHTPAPSTLVGFQVFCTEE